MAPPRPRVTVVGLGPGGDEYLSDAVVAALTADPSLSYLRTTRHPSARRFGAARSFDALYDSAATFEDVYTGIVEALVAAATAAAPQPVVYAVPGSPVVAERTVELLRADERVDVTVVPAPSFLELAWDRLGIDPLAAGVGLLDAEDFPDAAAAGHGPFLVGQCWSRELLSGIKLAPVDGAGGLPRPVILHHLGLDDEIVMSVDWCDLDRVVEPDHLTSVFVPRWRTPLPAPAVEAGYEVLDALSALAVAGAPGRPEAEWHLEEELGDLLFQIVFHARLSSEAGAFDLADVARGIHDKLVHRHPHVFGEVEADTPDVVVSNWEAIKKNEKGRRSVTEGIPTGLPSLMLANKLARKARSVGLDPSSAADAAVVVESVRSLAERAATAPLHPDDPLAHDAVDLAAAVGEVLFVVADVAQRLGVDAEQALRTRALTLRDDVVAAEGVPDQEQDSH